MIRCFPSNRISSSGCPPDGKACIGGKLIDARLSIRKDLAGAPNLELHEASPPVVDLAGGRREHAAYNLRQQEQSSVKARPKELPRVEASRCELACSAGQLASDYCMPAIKAECCDEWPTQIRYQ